MTSLADSGAPIGVFTPRPYDYREFDVEDMAVGLLRLEGDATISLKISWAANVPDGAGGTLIMGTQGGLQLDPQLRWLKLVKNMGRYQVDVAPKVPADPGRPLLRALEAGRARDPGASRRGASRGSNGPRPST